MKKLLLSTLLLLLPMLASAYDFEAKNTDGVTIYYNIINNGTELEVTYMNDDYNSYSGEVNIPDEVTYEGNTLKVTSIGNQAFRNCTSLTSVTIPNSITSIGKSAFYYSYSLTSVHISDLDAWCIIAFYEYSSNPLGWAHHLFLNGEEIKNLVIPNSVTSIGDYAFSSCEGLTSVTIPNSVATIGDRVFCGCSGLTSMKVASGNTVYDSRNNCNAIIETATNELIQGCNTTVIPNSVTSIGNYAFYQCYNLLSLTIPNSVTSIGEWAFYNCSSLTSVTIPNSITTIETYVFSYCTALTSVTIPNSVTSIGDRAFMYCSSLPSVTIPNSVTSIGNHAFYCCRGLTSVISKMKNPCGINIECFELDVFYLATLYVPRGTKEKYQSTNYWSKFKTIEEFDACATPTIGYGNKELTFSCDTEGVEYHYTITDTDIKSDVANSVDLSATYVISVYATKAGLEDSDVATATLVWMSAQIEGGVPIVTPANAPTESVPVLISSRDGFLTVKSELEGQTVSVYTVDGKALGSAKVNGGQAVIATNLSKGEVVIVKVGDRSVKVKM